MPFAPSETVTDLAATPPINRWWVMLFCALWLLAGTVGHDPWKPSDAINLGIAFDMSSHQRWIVPHIAGDPWPTSPPLYFWVSAACGQLFQWLLPWHDAARLATTLFGAGFLWTLAISVRHLAGISAALVAPLLAIGTLGLLLPLHDAQPAIVGVFGFSLTLLALLKWPTTPRLGGLLLGLGIGMSFLGTGIGLALLSSLTALITLALGHLIHSSHPTQHPATRLNFTAASLALLTATGLILPWPYLLHQASPAFLDWWWTTEKNSLLPNTPWFSQAHFKLLFMGQLATFAAGRLACMAGALPLMLAQDGTSTPGELTLAADVFPGQSQTGISITLPRTAGHASHARCRALKTRGCQCL